MATYRLERPGEVDLEFDGEKLADESTLNYSRGDRHVDRSRWTEIRIYRLDSGNGWVVERVGKSSRKGEIDRPMVAVCEKPEQVRESLKRRTSAVPAGYLIDAAVQALADAAERDKRLQPATVERI